MNPIKVAGLVAASLVFVGWGASNYVSPEFLAVAPDGASVYVTAATGAVVLESKQQYKENDLEPVDAQSVPTVPEPSAILCLVIVAVVFVLARKRIRADNR